MHKNLKKTIYFIVILNIASLFVACGGGGSGSDARQVSGVWAGSLNLQSNTCGTRAVTQTGSFTHTVNQNEDAVTLNDGNGTEFLGNTVGDNGFSVDALTITDNNIGGGVTCDETQRLEYNGVETDTDSTADVTLTTKKECSDAFTCEAISIGNALKGSGSTGDAGATPTATPSETASTGCDDLLEREFSGDSDCGIGQVTTSVNGSTVVLTPLGANGATSFAIDSTDSTSATASNTDLQIMGENGYSCSIECTQQITFTLNCFKEGGSTCSERF
ncbi:MAG: hypothetical protein KDD56_10005 [Bdellovibrionales bacterium]|nr:hypothetical protein [Bdellovibrionales bacterium]